MSTTSALPTLEAFKALTQPQRAAVFLGWLRTEAPERPTHYQDNRGCPLARFGAALCGEGYGSSFGFIPNWNGGPCGGHHPRHPDHLAVLTGAGADAGTQQEGALRVARTYGQLTELLSPLVAQLEVAQ